MSDVVIRVENVWKQYRLGSLKTIWSGLRRAVSRPESSDTESEFWALKDIAFEVRRGETVGIVGHNGSGKSTLLKTLCGVTNPTRGHLALTGRVVPLIEVGAGFHPELSG